MQIHERIKLLREHRGLSQESLALMVGYRDRSSIAKVESGKVDLTQSKISAFAEALGVTPAELLGWEDAKANLQIAGLSLADVAEEMNVPVDFLVEILQGNAPPEAAAMVIQIANALAAAVGPVKVAIAPREYALIMLYRSASAKDRAVVDTVLGLE